MSERFAVVIPALDAVHTVGTVVSDALRELPRVIVVDDGSTDGTGDAARAAGAEVVRHERNLGKGAALKSGFLYALDRGVDAVITLDADAQHLPREIGRFIEAYQESGADLIIGSRAHLFPGWSGAGALRIVFRPGRSPALRPSECSIHRAASGFTRPVFSGSSRSGRMDSTPRVKSSSGLGARVSESVRFPSISDS